MAVADDQLRRIMTALADEAADGPTKRSAG
jgi:hypothetical protein